MANSGKSLKEMFQGMIPEGAEIMQGVVISASPLKIQMTNDEKLVINERITVVPWHLTDYTTKIDIEKRDGTIDSLTYEDGEHHHMYPSSPPHGPTTETKHKHALETYNIYQATIKVYNALKLGDLVYVLSLNNGKLYFVLDRVCDWGG